MQCKTVLGLPVGKYLPVNTGCWPGSSVGVATGYGLDGAFAHIMLLILMLV
jgi:hypothetical protein